MVLDTSAVVAILLNEPEKPLFLNQIDAESDVRISAASVIETLVVLGGRLKRDESSTLKQFIRLGAIVIEPVTADQAWAAADAYRRWGKGNHPAGLNFGECFTYAPAKALGAPLLFKGNDFARTDVTAAVP